MCLAYLKPIWLHANNRTLNALQKTSDTKFADYQPHVAFFFPGQGAQAVGMAKVSSLCQHVHDSMSETDNHVMHKLLQDLLQDVVNEVAAAKHLFEQASDILGYDLLNVCTEGKQKF